MIRTTPTSGAQIKINSAVHCSIETFNLSSAPKYVALSYTWGNALELEQIYINNKTFEVRKNLFNFLHSFRSKKANTRYLWVDQLCIDQTAVGERNHQVRLMSQIYQKCQYVIAWLDASSGFDAISFSEDPRPWLARDLLRNRYFTRLWVVQELVLPKRFRWLCGHTWIEPAVLARHAIRPFFINGRLSAAEWLVYRTESSQGDKTSELQQVLDRYAGMDCHDPRDKVYGLLGLVKKSERPEIDYNKSIQQVYLDVVEIVGTSRSPAFYIKFAQNLGFTKADIWQLKHLFTYLQNCGIWPLEDQTSSFVLLQQVLGFERLETERYPIRWWCQHEGRRYHYDCVPPYMKDGERIYTYTRSFHE
jgi:hypothetical protein